MNVGTKYVKVPTQVRVPAVNRCLKQSCGVKSKDLKMPQIRVFCAINKA